MDSNIVVVTGRLTKDPELRTTTNGTSVANTSVAVEKYVKDAENDVSFFDLTIWGKFGELVARKAKKGDLVTIYGRLEQRRWDAEDGTKRSKVEIVVNQMPGEWQFRAADGEQQTLPTDEPAPAAAPSDDDIPF